MLDRHCQMGVSQNGRFAIEMMQDYTYLFINMNGIYYNKLISAEETNIDRYIDR